MIAALRLPIAYVQDGELRGSRQLVRRTVSCGNLYYVFIVDLTDNSFSRWNGRVGRAEREHLSICIIDIAVVMGFVVSFCACVELGHCAAGDNDASNGQYACFCYLLFIYAKFVADTHDVGWSPYGSFAYVYAQARHVLVECSGQLGKRRGG